MIYVRDVRLRLIAVCSGESATVSADKNSHQQIAVAPTSITFVSSKQVLTTSPTYGLLSLKLP